ncbi:MAG: prolipoprotein diacylglyceryl transferase, partial [Akkermansiaceae bacterium]|nr:prolipoprotein diacylglyceryl transferase [Akkermansiaceae bacterium]
AGPAIDLDRRDAWRLGVFLASGVLLGGRLVEVIFYEWDYYGSHPGHIPAVWLGGMSTHGILLGATAGVLLFCWRARKNFLGVADLLAVAGAFIMGVGRLGNFIDGQISGSVTEAWWGVKFPDLDDFRHPVVLYDGLKNLLLVPVLLLIRRMRPPRGVVFAHFILWYGFLRIFVDYFREYRVEFHGLPPGQGFNLVMTAAGIAMLVCFHRRGRRIASAPEPLPPRPARNPTVAQRLIFTGLVLFPLVIPSDWTQDVPERYGKRHPGLEHSWLYPAIPAD